MFLLSNMLEMAIELTEYLHLVTEYILLQLRPYNTNYFSFLIPMIVIILTYVKEVSMFNVLVLFQNGEFFIHLDKLDEFGKFTHA